MLQILYKGPAQASYTLHLCQTIEAMTNLSFACKTVMLHKQEINVSASKQLHFYKEVVTVNLQKKMYLTNSLSVKLDSLCLLECQKIMKDT